MYYVYILQSLSDKNRRYIGYSTDLKQRLSDHNSGKSPYTSKYMPWKIAMYLAFEEESKALSFERYLKSGSGHAFAKKHFLMH